VVEEDLAQHLFEQLLLIFVDIFCLAFQLLEDGCERELVWQEVFRIPWMRSHRTVIKGEERNVCRRILENARYIVNVVNGFQKFGETWGAF